MISHPEGYWQSSCWSETEGIFHYSNTLSKYTQQCHIRNIPMQQTTSQSSIKLYVGLYLFRSKLWGSDGELNLKYLPCCWQGLVMQAVIIMNGIVQVQPLSISFQ